MTRIGREERGPSAESEVSIVGLLADRQLQTAVSGGAERILLENDGAEFS